MPNPGVTTLVTVRTAAARRADMATPSTTTFVPTAEWDANINASYFELYDLLVQKFGDDYFVAGTPDNWYQLVTTSTTTGYPLPDGSSTYKLVDTTTTAPAFYKLLGVDVKYGSEWIPLKPFTFLDRNRWSTSTIPLGTGGTLRYRLQGGYLWIAPQPTGGQLVRLWYVPRMTALVADGDLLDGVSGWEEYVIVDAAIKALAKEESDTGVQQLAKAALIARIDAAAENRDAGSPARVTDARDHQDSGEAAQRWWP